MGCISVEAISHPSMGWTRIPATQGNGKRKFRLEAPVRKNYTEIGSSYHAEYMRADDEIKGLTSRYYVRLANRLLVPFQNTKKTGGAWTESLERPRSLSVNAGGFITNCGQRSAPKRKREGRIGPRGFRSLQVSSDSAGTLIGLVAIIKEVGTPRAHLAL